MCRQRVPGCTGCSLSYATLRPAQLQLEADRAVRKSSLTFAQTNSGCPNQYNKGEY